MGRIGKPQRSKKHKKIKAIDPFYVGPRVADRKAATANEALKKDDDDSYLPCRLQEILKLRQQSKVVKKRKKNKFKKNDVQDFSEDPMYSMKAKGMTRPLKAVPKFKQKDGESYMAFLHRMDREAQAVIKRSQLADKYDVDIEETPSGELKMTKRKLGDEDEENPKNKKKTKNQKKAEKRKEKNLNKLRDEVDNFEEFQDEVKFGEVAMAPPTITAKLRGKSFSKKGRTQSLLLNDMLPSTSTSKATSTTRALGQVTKRKHMSVAQKRITDAERQKAIDKYRQLKKQKMGD